MLTVGKYLLELILLLLFLASMGAAVFLGTANAGSYCSEDQCVPDPLVWPFPEGVPADVEFEEDGPRPPYSIDHVLDELSAPQLPYSLREKEE